MYRKIHIYKSHDTILNTRKSKKQNYIDYRHGGRQWMKLMRNALIFVNDMIAVLFLILDSGSWEVIFFFIFYTWESYFSYQNITHFRNSKKNHVVVLSIVQIRGKHN